MQKTDDRYLGFLISAAARLQRTVYDRRMRNLGVTRSQWTVLVRLGWQPGCSQSELAELLEVEKATAGRLIDRLEEEGLLERRPDDTDRRINRIYMTERGQSVHDKIVPFGASLVEEELTDLSAAERETFINLMNVVKRRLQIMSEENVPLEAAEFENNDV